MSIALLNGKIYTLDNNLIAQALAIDKNEIIHVGTNQQILGLGKDFDQQLDLKGATVLPGFLDSHTHLGQLALESLWVNLQETTAKSQILDLLSERAKITKPRDWVIGVSYDDAPWASDETLDKKDLDSVSTAHPIFLRRVCGHYGVVNSMALESINEDWKYVDRTTGILLEDAVLGFMKIIRPEREKRKIGTRDMLPKIHSLGITGVREIVTFESIIVYRQLDERHELKLRVFGYVIIDDLEQYLSEYPDGRFNGENFNVIGVKIFLDGSLGARTAALKEPYSDEPGNKGKLLYSDSELRELFERIKRLDLSLMAHAIGDRATQQFLSIYNTVFDDQAPDNPKNHSLEHLEILDNELLKELHELGIWASVQPNFAGRWSVPGGLNEQRLGKERLARCNAYKTISDNNIPLSFGSDSMPLGPIFGIKSAIFHPVEGQRISPLHAIKAYSQNGYALLDQESIFGSITPGKFADIVILNKDPSNTSNSEFDDIKIIGTIFNGELVYSDGLEIRC